MPRAVLVPGLGLDQRSSSGLLALPPGRLARAPDRADPNGRGGRDRAGSDLTAPPGGHDGQRRRFERHGHFAAGQLELTQPQPRFLDVGRRRAVAEGVAEFEPHGELGVRHVQGAAGAQPGPQYGIMAQDLEKTPEGATLVDEDETGMKHVDTDRMTMAQSAALNEILQRIKALEGGRG